MAGKLGDAAAHVVGLPMGRTFVGGRAGLGGLGGLRGLGLQPGEPIDQLGDLAGQLQQDAVLLFDMSLEEGDALLHFAAAGIHGADRRDPCAERKPGQRPQSRLAAAKAASASSSSARVCAADIWVRMRALPWATTG